MSRSNKRVKKNTISLVKVRSRLACLWLLGAGLILSILIAQSIFGHYADKVQDVWSWVLPTIMPTLSLILTVLGADAIVQNQTEFEVRKTFFMVAYYLSAIYLSLVLIIIIIEPLTEYEEPLELLRLSNLWLGPIQGLVTSAMGILFFSQTKREKSTIKEENTDNCV